MATKGVVIQIAGDGAGAAKALELVDQHLRDTAAQGRESGSEISEAMEKVKGSLEMVGVTVVIGEAINMMKEMVAQSLELGEAIEKAGQKTGLAAGTLSTLHYAAAITGSDFDGLTSAVSKMDKTIGAATEGDKKAEAFMKALGLNAKDLAGRTDGAEIAFKKFTQTLAATENPIRRVELATALLGKAGAAQIPMLMDVGNHWDEFKKKAQDAGVYLDGPGAAALAETNEKLHDLQQHLLGASIGFTEGLSPSLTQMLNVMSSGQGTVTAMTELGDVLGRTFAFVGEAIYSAAAAAKLLFATYEGGALTKWGREGTQAASDLLDKANAMRDIAFGDRMPGGPGGGNGRIVDGAGLTGGPAGTSGSGGFHGTGLGGKEKGGNAPAAAAAVGPQIDKEIAAEWAKRSREAIAAARAAVADRKAPAPAVDISGNLGAQMAASEKLRVQTEALQALDQKGDAIKRESGIVEDQITQKALTGAISRQAEERQLNDAHRAEVAQLQALAQEYAQYGAAGRDAYAAVEKEITRTEQAMQKETRAADQPFAKLAEGVTSMAEKMAQATGRGRKGFHEMAASMEADLVELAVKFAAQKWLQPFMTGLGAKIGGGGGGSVLGSDADFPGFAAGGDPTGPSIVGEDGPELFFPKGPGTVMPNDALQTLSRAGGGGGAPNMTVNLTNASSQPVTARTTGTSFDSDSRQYVTHMILEDLNQGGPISSALRPGG